MLARIPTPNIAHMMPDRGPFPRPGDKGLNGYFAVIASTSPHRVRWIDPYVGQIDGEPAEFCEFASGRFFVFDEAHALPRASSGRLQVTGRSACIVNRVDLEIQCPGRRDRRRPAAAPGRRPAGAVERRELVGDIAPGVLATAAIAAQPSGRLGQWWMR